MAKQSKKQAEIVERVMHEYAHGELATNAGRVKDRKQAIAIALSEAGESNRASSAENRERLRKTAARERQGATGRARREGEPTKAALYAEAKRKQVPGRSKMSKAELAKAVER